MADQPNLQPKQPDFKDKPDQIIQPWKRGEKLLASRLNETVEAVNRGIARAAPARQLYNKTGMMLYECMEAANSQEPSVTVQRLMDDGTLSGQNETFFKGQFYSVAKWDRCMFMIGGGGKGLMVPMLPVRYLYFQQGSDEAGDALDMPDDDKTFFTTHMLDRDYDVMAVDCFGSGEWNVSAKIAGAVQADSFTDGTSYAAEITTPYKYQARQGFTLLVNSSTGVEGFEMIFTLRENLRAT